MCNLPSLSNYYQGLEEPCFLHLHPISWVDCFGERHHLHLFNQLHSCKKKSDMKNGIFRSGWFLKVQGGWWPEGGWGKQRKWLVILIMIVIFFTSLLEVTRLLSFWFCYPTLLEIENYSLLMMISSSGETRGKGEPYHTPCVMEAQADKVSSSRSSSSFLSSGRFVHYCGSSP